MNYSVDQFNLGTIYGVDGKRRWEKMVTGLVARHFKMCDFLPSPETAPSPDGGRPLKVP